MNYATIQEVMFLVVRYNRYLLEDEERMTFAEMAEIMGYASIEE